MGLEAKNKINGSPLKPYNYGFDDDKGDYKVIIKDHIGYRYEVIEPLGKGSFGQALKCFDHKDKEFVAIKIIRNKKKFQHQAGVEVKILKHLRDHDENDDNNIIKIKDYIVFRKHLCISFEILSIDLYEFIKNNNFRGVSLGLIRRFAIQILQALKYIKEERIIHCDLKPENILLKNINKSGIKIIDFGSSCFEDERIYTYIQSRFYRAPEIILGIPYTSAIDIWSFGCILAELYSGYPLFPGESEHDQLGYIMEICGLPSEKVLMQATRRKLFFDEDLNPILKANSRGKMRRPYTKSLSNVLQCADKNFIRFLKGCLAWDPGERLTPVEALMHEWILEGLPPKVLIQHKRMLGIDEFPIKNDDKNKTQNLMENLLAFSSEGNKSHRSHRRKVSNYLSRDHSDDAKEEEDQEVHPHIKASIKNGWMENPYQDIIEPNKNCSLFKKKKYFSNTDNNLAGIKNLVKDEDLLMCMVENKDKSKNIHKSSLNRDC